MKTQSWEERTKDLYADRLQNNDDPMMTVWYRKMSEESKDRKTLSYQQIDDKLNTLLEKGYRIVKCSAISPRGKYNLENFQNSKDQEMPAAADTLFFELPVEKRDFEDMYKIFGMFYNNFPDYFKDAEDFAKYAQKSDIWIIEDVKTNKPVGFSTYNMITAKSPDAAEYQEDYGFKEKLLYHDTIALSPEIQGKGVGHLVTDIIDGYYLQYFGKGTDYGLCTGEINTSSGGRLSNEFHSRRGYDVVSKQEDLPLSKWTKRYQNIAQQATEYEKKNHAAFADIPLSTMRSYRNRCNG